MPDAVPDAVPGAGLVRSFCTALKPPAPPSAARLPGGHAASGRSRPSPPGTVEPGASSRPADSSATRGETEAHPWGLDYASTTEPDHSQGDALAIRRLSGANTGCRRF